MRAGDKPDKRRDERKEHDGEDPHQSLHVAQRLRPNDLDDRINNCSDVHGRCDGGDQRKGVHVVAVLESRLSAPKQCLTLVALATVAWKPGRPSHARRGRNGPRSVLRQRRSELTAGEDVRRDFVEQLELRSTIGSDGVATAGTADSELGAAAAADHPVRRSGVND